MDLSVITPVLNESFFLPLYLKAVSSFAAEICILDGGSTDGTYEMLLGYKRKYPNLRIWQQPQTGLPYSCDWQEGKRRQFLLDQTTQTWVLALDCDEFMGDNFKAVLPHLLSSCHYDLYEFRYLPFWRDTDTIRLSTPRDPHWEGFICRLGRRERLSYSRLDHHAPLLYGGKPLWEHPRRRLSWICLYHYHYALGPRIKHNDNRRGDVNIPQNSGQPDWTFEPADYPVITAPFKGSHPRVIKNYLQGKMKYPGGK